MTKIQIPVTFTAKGGAVFVYIKKTFLLCGVVLAGFAQEMKNKYGTFVLLFFILILAIGLIAGIINRFRRKIRRKK